jgi:hypothetical protein
MMSSRLKVLFVKCGVALLSSCGVGTQAPHQLPYGTTRLHDTNIQRLEVSLKEQLIQAKIKIPKNFNLFPTHYTDIKKPLENTSTQLVLGETPTNTGIDGTKSDLDYSYLHQNKCSRISFDDDSLSWRVFTALHETTHYTADMVLGNSVSLNDVVFSSIHVSAFMPSKPDIEHMIDELIDTPSYNWSNLAHSKYSRFPDSLAPMFFARSSFSQSMVTIPTVSQISERIADVSAELYSLSNYTDHASDHVFIQKIIDYRVAHYTDTDHNTVSSLRAGLHAFEEYPVHGLSIVQTTLWAAQIIEHDQDISNNLESLADSYGNGLPPSKASKSNTHSMSATNFAREIEYAAAQTLNARNRVCITNFDKSLSLSLATPRP